MKGVSYPEKQRNYLSLDGLHSTDFISKSIELLQGHIDFRNQMSLSIKALISMKRFCVTKSIVVPRIALSKFESNRCADRKIICRISSGFVDSCSLILDTLRYLVRVPSGNAPILRTCSARLSIESTASLYLSQKKV